jgi:hypothetical protein
MKGVALFVQDIINGNIASDARELLLSSKLIALDKGTTDANGVQDIRPISIGEYWYRLAGSYLLSHIEEEDTMANLFLPHQLGVGIPGGCEIAVHAIRNDLIHPDQPCAAFIIDEKNAFNTLSRATMLNTLYENDKLKSLYRLCDFAYRSPTPLLVQVGRDTHKRLDQLAQHKV